jgi:hypothetical protein
MAHTFDWLKPSALWQDGVLDFRSQDFFQPQLLAFHSDTFMPDFFAAAAAPKGDALRSQIATPPSANTTLKLYQPSHGCFYLVCASLCCRLPGFPDRVVETSAAENTFFVLRRRDTSGEYGWINNQTGAGWTALTSDQIRTTLPTEKRFPIMTAVGGNGRPILFGYVSIASRETYGVPAASLKQLNESGKMADDLRIEELRSRFSNQLNVLNSGTWGQLPLAASVYLLLDLWDFLDHYLPDVAAGLQNSATPTFNDPNENALIGFLTGQTLQGSLTLAAALHSVALQSQALNQIGDSGDQLQQDLKNLGFDDTYNLQGVSLDLSGLEQAVNKALPPLDQSIDLPKIDTAAGDTYVLRCVYERPQCDPPIQIVSQPTSLFQLAPFFDPDAPARPVKIPLPGDVSIAGLRRFKKGVTFLLSDSMRQRADSVSKDPKGVINGNPPPGTDSGFAVVCTFSIQIIFIVAFMLLIMFVFILNIVFWWVAFFRICLPIPRKLLLG